MQIPWQAPTPGEENIGLWHTRLQSIFGDHDDDADIDDADHDDDCGDDEKGLEDKMGCDQTEDLDGAFVPPLSDHPCLQCPALSTNRTKFVLKTNHNVQNHMLWYLVYNVETLQTTPVYNAPIQTLSYYIIPHITTYPCPQRPLQTLQIQRSKAHHILRW